jgi:UDP-3-O-[3-hydroxymyristoyl] N-acetylglucosamine deacetylase
MKTISKSVTLTGEALHSGNLVVITIAPSSKEGIRFIYNHDVVDITVDALVDGTERATQVTNGVTTINTPEHFLSACYALSLTNIDVTLSHDEFPILDGSSRGFIAALLPLCVDAPEEDVRPEYCVKADMGWRSHRSEYHAFPYDGLRIDAIVSYPSRWVQTVAYHYIHSLDAYQREIASARTYGFTDELEMLREKGLAQGGNLGNALIITDTGYMNEPRFPDEMVRHKILDFIGDMAVVFGSIKGHFVLVRPSHHGNAVVAKSMWQHLNRLY